MRRGVATVALLGLILLCLIPWTLSAKGETPHKKTSDQEKGEVSRATKADVKSNTEGKKQIVRRIKKMKGVKSEPNTQEDLDEKSKRRRRRCKTRGSCLLAHGTCRPRCKRKEIKETKHRCRGKQKGKPCVCCIEDIATTKPPTRCSQEGACQGHCRRSCLGDENEDQYAACYTPGCICCVPVQKECSPHSSCLAVEGSCKKYCNTEHGEVEKYVLCHGDGCVCCARPPPPPRPCSYNAGCGDKGGTCKSKCLDTEDQQPWPCATNCYCCVPSKCSPHSSCSDIGGSCKKSCSKEHGDEEKKGVCPGDGCLCCIPPRKATVTLAIFTRGLGGFAWAGSRATSGRPKQVVTLLSGRAASQPSFRQISNQNKRDNGVS